MAVALLLGADEIGFATAPLIVSGCIMMRKCHLNTCPVGLATQDPELRKKFTGKPKHVVNYFFFVAEELRRIMARLGFARVDDMIGQSDRLRMRRAIDHWKAKGLDFTRLLTKPQVPDSVALYNCEPQDHGLDRALDRMLIDRAEPALERGEPVRIELPVKNYNRTFGTMLSGRVAQKYGLAGLPDDTIHIQAKGVGGQSWGAWVAKGITIELEGEANDYVGKGLSGGRLVVYPPRESGMADRAEDNIIVGNTVLYGAVSGECYFRGVAGERFCVRNSGATAVIEGVGDHGCEYMTGGVMVCLGPSGRNFAAGMSGGIAYVLDADDSFRRRCNMTMVELEPIVAEDDALEALHQAGDLETMGRVDLSHDMTRFDAVRLRRLIANHKHYTGSRVAERILDHWADYLPKFVKVMPLDYRRALTEMQAQHRRPPRLPARPSPGALRDPRL